MNAFTARDVQRIMTVKQERKKESYMKVVSEVFGKIKKVALLSKSCCFFEVPDFMLGFPIYDLNECIQFVMTFLKERGFDVHYLFPRILYITWAAPPSSKAAVKARSAAALPSPAAAPHVKALPGKASASGFIRSISDFKPSGKFVLRLN